MRTYLAELLRSTSRGTYGFLAVCLALMVFGIANAGPQHESPLWGYRQAAIVTATLLMGRAATVAASDFSGGTIRPWLISAPSRIGVGLGKLAASVSIAVGFASLSGLVAYTVSGAFGPVPAFADLLSATGELMAACAILTVFGHAVGLLTRNVPAALTLCLGWVLAAEHVLEGRFAHSTQWLPGLATQQITLDKLAAGGGFLAAFAHALIPFAVIEALALVLFVRRDVRS